MRKQKSNIENNKQNLLPYQVIKAAVSGMPDAVYAVLKFYDNYMLTLATRHYCDEKGKFYHGVDEEVYNRLQTKLMQAILLFRL